MPAARVLVQARASVTQEARLYKNNTISIEHSKKLELLPEPCMSLNSVHWMMTGRCLFLFHSWDIVPTAVAITIQQFCSQQPSLRSWMHVLCITAAQEHAISAARRGDSSM